MPIASVKPVTIRDSDDLFQRDVRKAVKQLDQPGDRVVTLKNIALSATTVRVPHQLGRVPSGWHIIDITANAAVWRDTSQAMTNDYIPLKASGAVTVSLQVW